MTHLHEDTVDGMESEADRFASYFLARHDMPGTYAQLHLLVSVAYLEGTNAELRRIKAKLRRIKAKLGGAA